MHYTIKYLFLALLLFNGNLNAQELWRDKSKDVFVMGQSIFDFAYRVHDRKEMDALIAEFDIKEGYSQLVSRKIINHILHTLTPLNQDVGGSASNTAVGLSKLGAIVTLMSVVGDDELGSLSIKKIINYGIYSLITRSSVDKTGIAAVIISEKNDSDGNTSINRTMLIYPGVSAHQEYYNVDNEAIIDHKVIFSEGYLWGSASTKIKELFSIAKKNNSLTAFTFGDKYVVSAHRKEFLEFIKNIDIVFTDDDQLFELYQEKDLESITPKLQANNNITVITMADKGAYVVTPNERKHIPISEAKDIIDVTGAGDQFAAGFLYGYINDKSIEECGKLASLKAAEIIQKIGPKP